VVAGGNPLPLPPLETQALGESSRVITAANAETTTEEALYALALAQGLDPQVVAGVLWPGQAATALTAKGEPGGGGTDPSGILVRDSQLAFAVPPAWAALRGGEANAMPVGFSIELATNPPAGIERMNGAMVAGLDAAAISTMMPPGSPSTTSQALSTVATAAGPAAGLNPLLQAAIASPGPDALASQVRGSSPVESMTLAALTRGARPGEPSLAESKVTTPAGVASLPDTRPDLGAPSGLLRSPIADAASAQADRSARPLLTNPSAPLGSALVAPVTRSDLPASESKRDLVRSSPTSGANEGTDGAVDGPTDAVLALRASTNRGILGALQSSAPSAAEWMGRQFRGDPLGLGGPPPQSPSNPLAALAAQPLSTPLRRLADDGSSSGTDFGLGVGSSRQDAVDVSDLQQGPQQATRTEADRELARHRLSEALSSRMLAQVSRGEWDLQIDLKPGDLGHVKIEMSLHNGRLEAVFDAPIQPRGL
jgi:hypothetical protein